MLEEYTQKFTNLFSTGEDSSLQAVSAFAQQYLTLLNENRMYLYTLGIGMIIGYVIFKVKNR